MRCPSTNPRDPHMQCTRAEGHLDLHHLGGIAWSEDTPVLPHIARSAAAKQGRVALAWLETAHRVPEGQTAETWLPSVLAIACRDFADLVDALEAS